MKMERGINKATALLVTLLMIGSAVVVMMPTATKAASVTNNNAPEVLVIPGTPEATNVLVANFTLDGTIDVTIAGTIPDTGTTLITNNPWSDVYFYDDGDGIWENTKDAIWEDDGNVYYDVGKDPYVLGLSTENVGPGSTSSNPWSNVYTKDGGTSGGTFEDTADTIVVDVNTNTQYDQGTDLYIGVEPSNGEDLSGWSTSSNPWSNVYTKDGGTSGGTFEDTADTIWVDDGEVYYDVGIDTHIAGVNTENTGRGTITNPWASAEQPVVFYDSSESGSSDNAWDPNYDWIGLDGYIKEIKVENTGTATQNEITNVKLWLDSDGDKKFEPTDGDQQITEESVTTPDDKTWVLTFSPNHEIDGSTQLYFISADIKSIDSDFSVKRNTIKMKVEVKVINSPTATFSFTNKYTQKIAILGVTYFEGNQDGPVDVIATNTKDIKYGAELTLMVKSSALTDGETYKLYYPHFKRSDDGTYTIEWLKYKPEGSGEPAKVTADGDRIVPVSAPVNFNVSGMWILDNDDNPTDAAEGSDSDNDFAYFWVNGTEAYSIEITKDEVYYGKNETITVTVTEDGTAAPVWIDVRKESNEYQEPVLHQWCPDGKLEFTADWDNFTTAGNYTVVAYRDLDNKVIGYETYGFTEWYGLSHPNLLSGESDGYSDRCGPWDPPEKVSAVKKIVVKTGEPQLEIPETNRTMYWSFPGEVKIYTKGYDGKNLTFSDSDVKVYNSEGNEVTSHLTIEADTGVIKISSDSWGKDGTVWGKNGTWKVVIAKDTNGDGTEEWNGSISFLVTQAPGIQIRIISPEKKEIPAVPSKENIPIKIWFQVLNREHDYLGRGDLTKDADNITLSGGALFLEEGKTLKEYGEILSNAYGYESNNTWWVNIIPIMKVGGSELKISVDWGKWGTAEETILIGGTQKNGSVVSISPKEFYIGKNETLTVTVKDAEGDAYKNAHITLYYMNDDGTLATSYKINETNGNGTSSGEYTFLFNVTQQTKNQSDAGFTEIKAPRYIVAYVDLPNVGGKPHVYGYAVATMKPRSDLKVEISKNKFMAGKYYHLWINVSKIDTLTGNKTGTPEESGLHIKICNKTGGDVTSKFNSWGWTNLDGHATIELTSAYALEPGTYTIYAYNNTHTSEGHNATFEVIPVKVEPSLSELIWKYDENVTVTFEVKWNDNLVGNGTLRILNITNTGTYNQTWVNYSADTTTNKLEVKLENGMVTIYNITAEILPDDLREVNITFQYKPEDGADFANATGRLPIRVPHITPTPDTIALGEHVSIEILATGRDNPLEGVNISLVGPGNIKLNATTDSHGIARFAFLPTATGFIDIYAEGRKTTERIEVTSHYLRITAPAQVYEDDEFEVTVKDETGAAVKDAQVTINGDTKTTNAEGKVTFTLSVAGNLNSMQYTITARKAGYISAEKSIVVMNKPQLYVSITPEGKLTSGQKFKVKVTSDTGAVYGVHVRVLKDGKLIAEGTVTAPEGVTLTAPKVNKETTYTVIVEKDGYKSAEMEIKVKPGGGIPGFELVTLIAAIGVAFILLRRRQH